MKYVRTINLSYIVIILCAIFIACSSKDVSRNYNDLIIRENLHKVQLDTNSLEDMAIDYVIKGSTLQQQKKFAESILEFQQALKYDSSASIHYAISKNYVNLGMYEPAFESILKALKIKPQFIPAMELLSELYFIKKNISDAILVFKEIIKLEPSRNRKLYLAGLYEYNNIDSAIKIYETISEDFIDENILLRIAELYEKKGDSTKMLDAYEKLIQYSTNKPQAYDFLLRNYLKAGNYKQAFSILDSSKLLFSQDELLYFYNVTGNYLLDDTNNYAENIIPKYLDKLNNNFYFDWRINMIAGYLANKINDTTNTELYFNRAMKADSIADVYIAVSMYYLQNQKQIKAWEILNNNEKFFPDNVYFPLYKGIICLEIDSIQRGLTELYRALEIS